ncbi:MAG: TIR domain-containing protein [Lachnospiraceae bacterium]|nr:TIR domain-containing protein [Lachnospiraceae bacterium]
MKKKEDLTTEEVFYDAFISYRHAEIDGAIAEKLHRKLERYHIPKQLQKKTGKKKISRIFRDQEELPLSFSLTDDITKALDHSEFLIVLCSKTSRESKWVQREIEYFSKVHGKERILTLLVNDEPEDAFPDQLRFRTREITDAEGNRIEIQEEIEPLAADIRGATQKERFKKLDSEILRLIAPMLGCTYDELKQRHKAYRNKRIAAGIGTAAAVALVFSGYGLYKNTRLNQANQERIRNQGRYLAALAQEKMDSQQPAEAMELALSALPDQYEESEVIPDIGSVLHQGLHTYQLEENYVLSITASYSYDGINQEYFADAEDNRLFTTDGNQIFIWNLETNGLEQTIESGLGSIYSFSEQLLHREDNLLVLTDKFHMIQVYDYASHRVVWEKEISENLSGITLLKEKKRIITVDQAQITVYDLHSGETVQTFDLDLDGYTVSCDALAVSPDEKILVFDVHDDAIIVEYPAGDSWTFEAEIDYMNRKQEEEQDAVLLFQLADGTAEIIEPGLHLIDKLQFLSDDQLLLYADRSIVAGYRDEYSWSTQQMNQLNIALMNIGEEWLEWTEEIEYGPFTAMNDARTVGDDLFLITGNKCLLFDRETGTIRRQWEMKTALKGIWSVTEEEFRVFGEDGTCIIGKSDSDSWDTVVFFERGLTAAVQDAKSFLVRYESYGSDVDSRLVRYQFVSDENYVELKNDERETVEQIAASAERSDTCTGPDRSYYQIADGALIKYNRENGKEVWKLILPEYWGNLPAAWNFLDENLLILTGSNQAREINVSDENYGIITAIANVVYYDAEENCYYMGEYQEQYDVSQGQYAVEEVSVSGKFPRYSLQELEQIAGSYLEEIQ